MKSSHAIAALLATAMGLGAALPALGDDPRSAAMYWNGGPGRMQMGPMGRNMGPGRGMMGPSAMMGAGAMMGPAGLLGLACSQRGAEALEIALVRLSYRLDLTAQQQPLFDAFRAKALTTQTSFADACAAARPDRAAGQPDFLARLKARLAIDEARLTALNAVLPDFEALYNSLSDAQRQLLMPGRGFGMGMGMGRWQGRDRGPAPGGMPSAPTAPQSP